MSTYGSTGPASPVRPPAPETNVLAVLGLIFAFLFPLLGLIFSVLALRQIGQQPARYTGRTLAVVGLLISIGLLLLGVIVGALFIHYAKPMIREMGELQAEGPPGPGHLPPAAPQAARDLTDVFSAARASARRTTCLSNVKNLSTAAYMWAQDHGGKLPTADHWVDDVLAYGITPETLKCPEETSPTRTSYALNAALSGASLKSLPDPRQVVVFYETAHPGDHPAGGPKDVVTNRHTKDGAPGANYAYADGSAGWAAAGEKVSFAAR